MTTTQGKVYCAVLAVSLQTIIFEDDGMGFWIVPLIMNTEQVPAKNKFGQTVKDDQGSIVHQVQLYLKPLATFNYIEKVKPFDKQHILFFYEPEIEVVANYQKWVSDWKRNINSLVGKAIQN